MHVLEAKFAKLINSNEENYFLRISNNHYLTKYIRKRNRQNHDRYVTITVKL